MIPVMLLGNSVDITVMVERGEATMLDLPALLPGASCGLLAEGALNQRTNHSLPCDFQNDLNNPSLGLWCTQA